MSDLPTSLIRHFRSTGPFSKDEAKWVILKYEELKSVQNVRRAFRKQFYFYPSHPKKVPGRWAFERLLERFKDTGSLKPEKPTGRRPITKRTGRRGRKVLQDNPRCSRKRSVRKAEHWIWNSMEDPQTKIEMETIPSAHESTFVPSKQEVETAGLQVLFGSLMTWNGLNVCSGAMKNGLHCNMIRIAKMT